MTTTFFPEQLISNKDLIIQAFSTSVGRSPTEEELSFWVPKLFRYSFAYVSGKIKYEYSTPPVIRTDLLRNPIAQSFYVDQKSQGLSDNKTDENGIFVSSITLFFKTIDEDHKTEFNIEIRPLVNGIPSDSVIIVDSLNNQIGGSSPEAKVATVLPNGKLDLATGTILTFLDPVYLPPGGYALCVSSRSDKFELYGTKIGDSLIGQVGKVQENTVLGTLFRSQNAKTWDPDLTSDLCFIISRCNFDASSTLSTKFVAKNTSYYSDYEYDLIRINGSYNLYEPTDNIDSSITQNNSSYIKTIENIKINEDITLPETKVIKYDSTLELNLVLSQDTTTDNKISPVINKGSFHAVLIKNYINKYREEISNAELKPSGGLSGQIITKENKGFKPVAVSIPGTDSVAITSIYCTSNTNLQTGDYVTIENFDYFKEDFVDTLGDIGKRAAYPITKIDDTSFSIPVKFPNITELESNNPYWKIMNPRYISKTVTLEDGFDASGLTVYLDASRPVGTRIEVFYKCYSYYDRSGGIDSRPWVRLDPISAINYDALLKTAKGQFVSDVFQDLDTSYMDLSVSSSCPFKPGDVVYQESGGIRTFQANVNYFDSDSKILYLINIGGTTKTPVMTSSLLSTSGGSTTIFGVGTPPEIVDITLENTSGSSYTLHEPLYVSIRNGQTYQGDNSPFTCRFEKLNGNTITVSNIDGQLMVGDVLRTDRTGSSNVSRTIVSTNLFDLIQYDNFKQFAVKIVLYSNNSAVIPQVKNLRIIATP